MDDQNTLAWLLFQQLPGQTPRLSRQLLACFHHPQNLLIADDLSGLPDGMQSSIRELQQQAEQHPLYQAARQTLLQAQEHQVQLITLDSEHYPELLKQTAAPPLLLYVKGQPDVLSSVQLAVVGARKATPFTLQLTRQWCKALAAAGITITSGLALGIDASAHLGALDAGGRTVAVLAHGMDQLYPRQHRRMAQQILENGALISEFGFGQPPLREYFPQRNRIISGLSLGVLVAEAALKSGSLITARYAVEQNREVFAIPGSVNNVMARGCHHLIRQGAQLVENCDDILQALALPLSFSVNEAVEKSEYSLSANALLIINSMGAELMHPNDIQQGSGLDAATLASELMLLELDGVLAQQNGYYQKLL